MKLDPRLQEALQELEERAETLNQKRLRVLQERVAIHDWLQDILDGLSNDDGCD